MSEIVLRKPCSAATQISESLKGRPIELSKFPGEELVLDIDINCAFAGEDIEPELSADDDKVRAQPSRFKIKHTPFISKRKPS